MANTRIETDGLYAKVFLNGESIGADALGYVLFQRAGQEPKLRLFYDWTEMISMEDMIMESMSNGGKLARLEKRVAELEVQVRAQQQCQGVDGIVELMGKQIRDAVAKEPESWPEIDLLDIVAKCRHKVPAPAVTGTGVGGIVIGQDLSVGNVLDIGSK